MFCLSLSSPDCGDGECAPHEGEEACPWDCGDPPAECQPGESTGETTTDDNGMVWVSIPGGCFLMGCSKMDATCGSDELPVHVVNVPEFQLMQTQVTQAQHEAVTGKAPPEEADCPDCPADWLSWNEVESLCAALGARLPSEAEWEYAARAGSDTIYPCGNDATCLTEIAWFAEDSPYPAGLHPVALKSPNKYGLYDMPGNGSEWVADCFAYGGGYEDAPDDGSAWQGGACWMHVTRSTAASNSAWSLRSSNRNGVWNTSTLSVRCDRSAN